MMERPLVGLVFVLLQLFIGLVVAGSGYNAYNCAASYSLGATVTPIDCSCTDICDGSVTITAFGGTPPYSFLDPQDQTWKAGPWSKSSLCASSNSQINIRDSGVDGCQIIAWWDIVNPTPIANVAPTSTPVSCYGSLDGSATLGATGGTPPYQYNFNTQGWNAGFYITGLNEGTYSYQARDSRGCLAYNVVFIGGGKYPIYPNAHATALTCSGTADGTISLSASGGNNGGFQYNFMNLGWDTTTFFNNLGQGTYTYYVRDNVDGCTKSAQVNVGPNTPLYPVATPTPITCFGRTDGTVTLGGMGGSGNYEYNFNNNGWTTLYYYDSLAPGSYAFKVRDGPSCIADGTAIVDDKTQLFPSVSSATSPSCYGSATGSVRLSISGGTGIGYAVNFNNQGWNTSLDYGSLKAGIYPYKVRDNSMCEQATSLTMVETTTQITSSASVTPQGTCTGGSTASITITANGGAGTLLFSLDGGTFQISNSFLSVSTGTHHYVVRDTNLCTSEGDAIVEDVQTTLTAAVNITHIACNQDGDTGRIAISASGGNGAPYTYSINGGTNFGSQTQFSGLASGTYPVVVRDLIGCTYSTAVQIKRPSALQVSTSTTPQSCTGGNTGGITFNATGGNGNTTFTLNGVPTDAVNNTLMPGIYTWAARDSKSCNATGTVTVNPIQLLAPPTITSVNPIPTNGGIMSISGTNFNWPLYLLIDGTNTTITSSTTNGLSCNIAAGTGLNHKIAVVSGVQPCLRIGNYTWTYAKPIVSGTSSLATQAGPITIYGTNFGSSTAVVVTVTINSAACTSCAYAGGAIACANCPAATGNFPLVVTVDGVVSEPFYSSAGTCGNGECQKGAGGETCTTCESDCGLCDMTAPTFESLYNYLNSSDTIVAKWSPYPTATDSTFYVLQMSQTQSGNFTTVYNGTATQFAVKNLPRSTTYFFKIAAGRGSNLGNFSIPSKASTSGLPGTPVLSLARHARDYLTVAWKGSDGGCAMVNWRIQISNSSNGTWQAFTALPTAPQMQQYTNLIVNKAYYFRVQSTNILGASNETEISFTTDSPFCGDFVCDTAQGETCQNCFYDCDVCKSDRVCPGTTECSGNGNCVSGQCVCSATWSGPDCSVKGTVPISVGGNGGNGNNSASVTVNPVLPSDISKVAFNLAIKTIQEIEPGNNIKTSYKLSDFKAEVSKSIVYLNITSNAPTNNNTTTNNTTLPGSNTTAPNTTNTNNSTTPKSTRATNTTTGNTTNTNNSTNNNTTKPGQPAGTIAVEQIVYNISLPNMATLEIILLIFPTATSYKFGNRIISVPDNSMKYSIKVLNWKFESIRNRLQIIMDSESNSESDSPCESTSSSKDGSDNLQWFVLNIDGVSLYVQFIDSAILDGRQGKAEFDLSASNEVIVSVPAFWESAEIDPTYSVLVDPSQTGDCASSKKSVPTKVIGGVVGAVGGAAAATAASWYIYRKHQHAKWLKKISSANNNGETI